LYASCAVMINLYWYNTKMVLTKGFNLHEMQDG
jgi:hypothetical protein